MGAQLHTAGWTRHITLCALLCGIVLGDCECGYTANVNSTNPGTWLFTDVIESDFLHIPNITLDTDWIPQSFYMDTAAARGPYGVFYPSIPSYVSLRAFMAQIRVHAMLQAETDRVRFIGINYTLSQLASNPVLDANNWTGPGELGGDPGVQMIVDGGVPKDGNVKTAEMDSNRTDMIWGTYRASLKLSPIVGTCAAFFWVSRSL
jgi:hypothetical protein